jgi:hypothetical protein
VRARYLAGLVACLLTLAASACSVDDRALSPALTDAGSSNANSGGAGSSNGGLGGDSSFAGARSDAGSAGEGETAKGGAGNSEAGASSGNGGSAGTHATIGGGGSGGGGGAVSGNVCPDLDNDSVPDCQESLVQNPSFDADVAGWIKEPSANESWQDQDAEKRKASGSLGVQNINVVDIDGSFMTGAKQCLAVTGGKNYLFYAKAFVASGQAGTPQGGLNVQFYNSNDCAGDPLTGRTSNLPDTVDTWSVIQMSSQAFSNANSMSVRLVVLKPFNAQPANVLFDDVLVRAE